MKKTVAIILILLITVFSANVAFAYPVLDTLPGLQSTDVYEGDSVIRSAVGGGTLTNVANDSAAGQKSPVAGTSPLAEEKKEEELPDALKDIIKNVVDATEQFLLKVTSPKAGMEEQTTYKKSYVFCGEAQKPGLRVVIAVYNPEKEIFTRVKIADNGEIGASNLFASEVSLREGENKVKIVVYELNEDGEYELGTNVQVSYFTITSVKETFKEQILNGVRKLVDVFNQVEEKLRKQ